jgi:peptidoglycan/LPS O-acetylase OafA/YrhL
MKYIKQLDSLRAIAVILVIISHWLPKGYFINQITNNKLGAFGVNVFFVLSGFLITGILLQNRADAQSQNISKGQVIKNFFMRRSIRIFPVYYLTITFLLLFAPYTQTGIKDNFIYFFTYTANLYFFKNQAWDGMLSHLWSLSVEEQFYLIWPWVILFCKEIYLKSAILVFIGLGVISEFLFSGLPLAVVITTSSFTAFGFGALLAWQLKYAPDALKKNFAWVRLAGILSLLLFGLYVNGFNILIPYRLLCTGVSVWVICSIILNQDKKNLAGLVLNNKILIGLGKMSYGLYLYHLILFIFSYKIFGYLETRGLLILPEVIILAGKDIASCWCSLYSPYF